MHESTNYILDIILVAAILWLIWILIRRRKKVLPSEIEIINGNLTIKGVRYKREDAPPVILVHGYCSNSRAWKEVGNHLYTHGYDVWMPNLRGHGLGLHRSHVTKEYPGCYGFQELVLKDYPTFVDFVSTQTGRPISIVAHSMGGMAAKSYLAGVSKNNWGQFYADEFCAIKLKEKIHAVILIGSPPHFNHMPKLIKWISKVLPGISATIQTALPGASKRHNPLTSGRGWILSIRRNLASVVKTGLTLAKSDWISGIIEVKNFDPKQNELIKLLEKGMSKLPKDLAYDANQWAKDGEVRSSDGFVFSKPRMVRVPLLFIAGELDAISPYKEVFAEAHEYAKFSFVRRCLVRDTSHVDLISGRRAANLIGPVILKFLGDPNQFSPDDSLTVVS